MALEASEDVALPTTTVAFETVAFEYAALALTATIAFGLISVSAFVLLNALSIRLHEKTLVTRLTRARLVYSMRSTEAQDMRDKPQPLYREALATYLTFCAFVMGFLLVSYICHNKGWLNMVLSPLFVAACLGYTGWVVFRVSTASRKFVSALRQDAD